MLLNIMHWTQYNYRKNINKTRKRDTVMPRSELEIIGKTVHTNVVIITIIGISVMQERNLIPL